MTANELELLKLYTGADTKGKEAIFDILICAVVRGEPFYNEAKELLDNGNKAALIECINKWVAISKSINTKSVGKAV